MTVDLNPVGFITVGSAASLAAGLSLVDCCYPLAGLPAMRAHMPQLQQLELELELDGYSGLDTDTLTSVLVQLCRPLQQPQQQQPQQPHYYQQQQQQQQGTMQLRELTCWGSGGRIDAAACRQSVLQQLEHCFGVTDVVVNVR